MRSRTPCVIKTSIIHSMSRNFDEPAPDLKVTRDQSEFLNALLPPKYSLVQSRSRARKNQMTIEELRFWECGGSYDFDPAQLMQLIKQEEDVDWKISTEGVNSVSEGEINQMGGDSMIKMEEGRGVIEEVGEEGLEEDSFGRSPRMLVEQQIEPNFGFIQEPESYLEPEALLKRFRKASGVKLEEEKVKSDFKNNLSLKPTPAHLLPFIEKMKARRRQKREKRIEKRMVKPQPAPHIPTSHIKPTEEPKPLSEKLPLPVPALPTNPPAQKSIKVLTTQQKHYLFILSQVRENKYEKLFEKPLSSADLEHLGYNLIEHKQITLMTIQSDIRANKYEHLEQLHRDLLQVWLTSYSFKPQSETAATLPSTTSMKADDRSELKSYLFNNDNHNNPIPDPKPIPAPIKKQQPQPKFPRKVRARLAEDIRSLGSQHMLGIWHIVTEGMNTDNYDVTVDLETMSEPMLEKLARYVEKNLEGQENRKERRMD